MDSAAQPASEAQDEAGIAPFLCLPPGGVAPDRVLTFRSADGMALRAGLWMNGLRGHVLLLNGRSEYIEKMATPAAELQARGFAVVSLDWRGQGLSARPLDEPLKGHVGDFAEYRADLDALLALPEVASLPGPRLVLAHSMGCTIATAALLDGVKADAAIFSAPMFGFAMSAPMKATASLTVWVANQIGSLDAWPPFGDVSTPYPFSDFNGNVLTGDRAVWDWMAETLRSHPKLALGFPTLGWFKAAGREMERLAGLGPLPCPSLCLLGSDERVVDAEAIRSASARLGYDLVEIDGARHEPLVEAASIRAAAWAAIDRFLDAALP